MPNLNELYERWRNAGGAERPEIEAQLAKCVQSYAQAIVFIRLVERNPDLVQEIASAVLCGLGGFRRESQFSTWAYSIAENKINQCLRGRMRHRRVFPEVVPVEDESAEEEEPPFLQDFRVERGLLARLTLEQLAEGLSPEDARLFRGICEGRDQNELAEDLGITSEAAQTRRRRLRDRLIQKVRGA